MWMLTLTLSLRLKKKLSGVVSRVPKDLKVQINTIKKAVKLAEDSGIKVKVTEK